MSQQHSIIILALFDPIMVRMMNTKAGAVKTLSTPFHSAPQISTVPKCPPGELI